MERNSVFHPLIPSWFSHQKMLVFFNFLVFPSNFFFCLSWPQSQVVNAFFSTSWLCKKREKEREKKEIISWQCRVLNVHSSHEFSIMSMSLVRLIFFLIRMSSCSCCPFDETFLRGFRESFSCCICCCFKACLPPSQVINIHRLHCLQYLLLFSRGLSSLLQPRVTEWEDTQCMSVDTHNAMRASWTIFGCRQHNIRHVCALFFRVFPSCCSHLWIQSWVSNSKSGSRSPCLSVNDNTSESKARRCLC